MFLSAFNLPKEVYIATAGAIGLLMIQPESLPIFLKFF
jgi:hypothetical protein